MHQEHELIKAYKYCISCKVHQSFHLQKYSSMTICIFVLFNNYNFFLCEDLLLLMLFHFPLMFLCLMCHLLTEHKCKCFMHKGAQKQTDQSHQPSATFNLPFTRYLKHPHPFICLISFQKPSQPVAMTVKLNTKIKKFQTKILKFYTKHSLLTILCFDSSPTKIIFFPK